MKRTFERHSIATAGLPFAELKQRALIDSASKAANDAPDFSSHIRKDRPGRAAAEDVF